MPRQPECPRYVRERGAEAAGEADRRTQGGMESAGETHEAGRWGSGKEARLKESQRWLERDSEGQRQEEAGGPQENRKEAGEKVGGSRGRWPRVQPHRGREEGRHSASGDLSRAHLVTLKASPSPASSPWSEGCLVQATGAEGCGARSPARAGSPQG